MTPIGRVCELAKYPVKSMAGTSLDSADLGLHGIEGDRRFAFRRVGDGGGFPFLTAGRFPELLTYQPVGEPLPTHVRTPSGAELEIRGDELRDEIARRPDPPPPRRRGRPLPPHVRPPAGAELETRGDGPRDETARRSGHAVELM